MIEEVERYIAPFAADHAKDLAGMHLLGRSYEQRIAEPCIGRDRADLVLAGCAILEAILRMWPCERLRVADRGLREGMLVQMMREDGAWGEGSADGGGQAVLS
jgi:exopolyphosphatase/pppGpp-phosphohydrolase